MQRQIDLLSRLSDLPLAAFTLFLLILQASLCRSQPPCLCLIVRSQYLSIPARLEPGPPVRGSEESWPDPGSCLSRVYFWARSLCLSLVVPPSLRDAVPCCFLHICVCQCGSWSGILSAVYSCCGGVAKARYGRQLVIRLIMLPFSEVGLMWLLSALYNVVQRGNLPWLNVLNVVRDVLHNA